MNTQKKWSSFFVWRLNERKIDKLKWSNELVAVIHKGQLFQCLQSKTLPYQNASMFIESSNAVVVVQSRHTRTLPLTNRLHVVSEHLYVLLMLLLLLLMIYVCIWWTIWAVIECICVWEVRESYTGWIWQVWYECVHVCVWVCLKECQLCVSIKQNKCAKMRACKRARTIAQRVSDELSIHKNTANFTMFALICAPMSRIYKNIDARVCVCIPLPKCLCICISVYNMMLYMRCV